MSGEDITDYAEFTSGKTLIYGGFEYTLGINGTVLPLIY
jgi:hypothetical protein